MIPVKVVVLLLLGLLPMHILALSTDRDQPIQIEADKLEIDDSSHISVYQGNVSMRQGSLDIKADRIVLHFDADKNLEWLDITGSPAVFKQLNARQQPISGSAQRMKYHEQQSLLEMNGNARFKSDKDSLESDLSTAIKPRDIVVNLLDAKSEVLMAWYVSSAWPVKWSVDRLNASENKVALETLEFAYTSIDRMVVKDLGAAGTFKP